MAKPKKPAADRPAPYDALVAAVMRDDSLRAALRQDPRGTIKRVLGIDVPADVEVAVLEESPNKLYVVLPATRAELSDEELDQVVAAGAPYARLSLASTRMARISATLHITDTIVTPSN